MEMGICMLEMMFLGDVNGNRSKVRRCKSEDKGGSSLGEYLQIYA